MPDVYQQAFALMEALWQPLIEHGVIERATAPQLSKWIEAHVGASFPPNPDEPARRHVYNAHHAWDDYRRGALDAYFWGKATEAAEHEPDAATDPAPDAPTPGLAQLLPRDLFDELCRLLSTTRDARIPEQPYASFGDYAKGLWFYGLHQLDGLDAKKRPQLTDQFCQRGIGPKGELILRSRPFGGITLDATDLDGYRGSSKTRELLAQATTADNLIEKRLAFLGRYSNVAGWKNARFNEEYFWHRQYKENRLDTLFDTRQLGSQTSTGDGMRTGLRLALDFAVCLPFAIACEVEKRLGERHASTEQICDELRNALLAAEVRGAHDKPGTGAPLFTETETKQLSTVCRWPTTPRGIAAATTCAIVRLLLDDAHTVGEALIAQLGGGAHEDLGDALTRYLEVLASWGDVLDLRDAPREITPSYLDLYVSPAFAWADPVAHPADELADPADANPACIVAQAPGQVRLRIQAGSGMGKTTFVKGLAAGIAQAQLEGDATLLATIAAHSHRAAGIEELIPVLITQPKPDRAGRGYELLEGSESPTSDAFAELLFRQLPRLTFKDPFLAAANDDPHAALEFFKRLLTLPQALVIVDSIDEVPLAVRDHYIECLEELARAYDIRRLIVTSRPLPTASEAKLEEAGLGDIVRLVPFDLPRQRELFENVVERYARMARNAPNERLTSDEQLFARVVATPGFAPLLASPLITTALAHALVRSPNASAYDTLRTLVELLPKLPERDPYDDDVLASIAYDLVRDGKDSAGTVTEFCRTYSEKRQEIREEAAGGTVREETIGDERFAERLVDRMVTRRGILEMRDSEIVFEHALIRAFFAAQHVLNRLTAGVDAGSSDTGSFGEAQGLYRALLQTAYAGSRGNAAELAVLILLSARAPYSAELFDYLHTKMYDDLVFDALYAWGDYTNEHDGALAILRASRTYNLGRACPRTKAVSVWESRLVELAAQPDADTDTPTAAEESEA